MQPATTPAAIAACSLEKFTPYILQYRAGARFLVYLHEGTLNAGLTDSRLRLQ